MPDDQAPKSSSALSDCLSALIIVAGILLLVPGAACLLVIMDVRLSNALAVIGLLVGAYAVLLLIVGGARRGGGSR